MNTILYPFIVLSLIGLVLSIFVHFASLLGFNLPDAAMGLHIGIFVVWIPTVIVGNRLTKNTPRNDYWKVALQGCPAWMKYMTYVFFGYAFINFALFFFGSFGVQANSTGDVSPSVLRGFSGHWMAFYSAALAMLYSGTRASQMQTRRCSNGHAVSLSAKYCEKCGLPVDEE